jgi:hypothetical protein
MAARAIFVACLVLVVTGTALRAQEPAAESAAEESPLPDLTKSRRWTDRNGRSVSGVFDRFVGDEVQLKVGAATQRIAYSAFSDEDQVILRRHMESRREGTSVPAGPKDLPDQRPRTWRDKSDRSVYGTLRRIDEQQRVVLQLDDRTATFVLGNFSPADQQHVRDQLTALGKSDLLPADDAVRAWRDWKGREFTGKLDPLHPPKSIVRTIHFLLDGGLRKSMDFVALSESDRELVRQLLESEGGGDKLPPPFPEPDAEIRSWTVRNREEPVEGKFVRLEGSSVIVRTETDAERSLDLALLADEDRQYVEATLQSGGRRAPILRADCRQWTFGPAGSGNTLTAKFSEAAEGYVKLLLPDEDPPAEHPKFVAIPYLCLSAANQDFVRQQWTGDDDALKPVSEPEPQIETRDWSYDNDELTVRGTLHYVTPSEVTIQAAVGLRRVPFAKLSGVDMDYVRRMIATYGMDQFAPPDAPAGPAGIVYSGPPDEADAVIDSGPSRLGLAHDEKIDLGEPMQPGEFWMVIFGVCAGALAILGLVHLFMKAIT